jgi:hypothetical protein
MRAGSPLEVRDAACSKSKQTSAQRSDPRVLATRKFMGESTRQTAVVLRLSNRNAVPAPIISSIKSASAIGMWRPR